MLLIFALISCALSEDLPPLGTTLQGMQRFGDYEVIYGAHEHRFLFGILIYRDPFTLEHHATLQLHSGITCEFITNEVAVTKSTTQVRTQFEAIHDLFAKSGFVHDRFGEHIRYCAASPSCMESRCKAVRDG